MTSEGSAVNKGAGILRGVAAAADVVGCLAGDLSGEAKSDIRREPGTCPPKNVSGAVSADRRLSIMAYVKRSVRCYP